MDRTRPARLHLGAPVVKVDVEAGKIKLMDDSVHEADLIVAGDGLHSVIRSAALKGEATPTASGLSAFRFLIPTKRLQDEPLLAEVLAWKTQGSSVLADTSDRSSERHIVWYDCQGYVFHKFRDVHRVTFGRGEVQNFVGIHPTRSKEAEKQAEFKKDARTSMLHEFSHFHPDILGIMRSVNHSHAPSTTLTTVVYRTTRMSSAGHCQFRSLCEPGIMAKYSSLEMPLIQYVSP